PPCRPRPGCADRDAAALLIWADDNILAKVGSSGRCIDLGTTPRAFAPVAGTRRRRAAPDAVSTRPGPAGLQPVLSQCLAFSGVRAPPPVLAPGFLSFERVHDQGSFACRLARRQFTQGVPQSDLGGVDGRPGGDHVRVRAVKMTEPNTVESDLRVVQGELQLPGGFIETHRMSS
ncbi:hypothetical protein, partial [Nonomuraea dietziae]|uniref:hypothetical protein n=1 Tax=Nonomuraea dietziae TaxID=65515 RepID=UPI003F4DCFE3